MKKLFLPLLFSLALFGCASADKESTGQEELNGLGYADFEDLKMEWKNLFSPAKSQYFIYIYGLNCQHCKNIKSEVLNVIDLKRDAFYLIEFNEEIPLGSNAAKTIGKEKVEDVFILGTPTLIEISNHMVAMNIAGEKEITSYLEFLPHSVC